MSDDPIPRLFAATAALGGTTILMLRSEPSWEGILIGLSCLGLWALGRLASTPGRPLRLTKPARTKMPRAVIVERPRPPPELLPAPSTGGRDILMLSTRLPEVPVHRQAMIERYRRPGR